MRALLMLSLATGTAGMSTLLYGPGSAELKLLAAKYIAKGGGEACVYAVKREGIAE